MSNTKSSILISSLGRPFQSSKRAKLSSQDKTSILLKLSIIFTLSSTIGCSTISGTGSNNTDSQRASEPNPIIVANLIDEHGSLVPAVAVAAPKQPEAIFDFDTSSKENIHGALHSGISKERAEHLAVQHLALRNARWGNPLEMKEDESYYLFFFETPIQESRLVGARIVTVDKESGLARIKPRR